MNAPRQLIPIEQSTIHQELTQTVNARDLHASLGVGKDFSNWIKVQIDRARLVENRDYISFAQKGEREIGATLRKDYHLTIDAAKHIAMMSGTDKGFEVRDYFIEVEKQSRALPMVSHTSVDNQLESHRVFEAFYHTAQMLGQNKRQSAHAANTATRKVTSVDILGLMELAEVPEAQPERAALPMGQSQPLRRFQQLLARDIEEGKITLRALARKIGIAASMLHDYTTMGTMPNARNLEKLGRHYNLTVDELLAPAVEEDAGPLSGYKTATELGESLGMTGRQFNEELARHGYLRKGAFGWELTAKGKKFAVTARHGKKPGAAMPSQRIKWLASVAAKLVSKHTR